LPQPRRASVIFKENILSAPENPQFDPPPLSSEPQAPAPFVVVPFPAPPVQPARPAPKAGEDPVWSGWDVLLILVLTAVTFVLAQLFVVPGLLRVVYPHASPIELSQKPVLLLLSQLLLYAVMALFMVLLVEAKYHARFWPAIRWNWPGIAGVSFVGVGVLMLGFDILGRFLPMPKSTPFDQFFDRPFDAYLTAAFAVTLGPLMEELFFRGFLYPVVARRWGAVAGVFFTALPFGLMHFFQYGNSWAAVLIVFLVGVVLTTVRAMTKSVAASFLAHVGYNGTLMMLAAWSTDGFKHMDKASMACF
jgi:membrane protease YdiL (CAAX protease family)